ncbi:MAG: hypothetical protein GY711_27510 [bacterium]|nr:hypothetical protein [bacterium]
MRPDLYAALHAAVYATLLTPLLAHLGLAQGVFYDAGDAGDPPVAPSPVTAGWTETVTGATTVQDVSPDPAWGINAWQITDPGNGHASYSVDWLSHAHRGIEITFSMRMLASTVVLEVDTGELIFDSYFEIEFTTQGVDVVVDSHPYGNSDPIVCPGGADGGYHEYTFRGFRYVLDFGYDGAPLGCVDETGWGLVCYFCPLVSIGTRDTGPGRTRFHTLEAHTIGYGPLGTSYCGPAVPNSSGSPATIEAFGWIRVSDNDFALTAEDLPPNQFGYFLASQTQAFVAMPGGSEGNLCVGGTIGRFNAQVASSGPDGSLSIPVDLTQMPPPLTSVVAGEAWNWQCWYRDAHPGPTSNFSDGRTVVFE